MFGYGKIYIEVDDGSTWIVCHPKVKITKNLIAPMRLVVLQTNLVSRSLPSSLPNTCNLITKLMHVNQDLHDIVELIFVVTNRAVFWG